MGKIHVLRVKPGQELLATIKAYCESQGIRSAMIPNIIGSLTSAKLGFLKTLPGKYITKEYKGPLEIVCCQGSIATLDDRKEGDKSPSSQSELVLHLHGMISNEQNSMGGHISEAMVFSTAEVFIQELDKPLKRYLDSYTGLREIE